MIPMRYMGPVHATGLMLREEGMRGLYRGFLAYLIATSLYLAVVPLAADIGFSKSAFSGNSHMESDDLFHEMAKSRSHKPPTV